MSTFDFYIHGTPEGHEIWGSEKNHRYIERFYDHERSPGGKIALNIDICASISYYTYIRQENVYDVNGRPGAFFALTVGFPNFYCTNVYKLYQLFDAIYTQLCADTIIQVSGTGYKYLVSEFQAAQKQGQSIVKRIENAFSQNEKEVIEPYLKPLNDNLTTFNRPKKVVSLLDVDSPAFFDLFKNYSLIVSPSIQSSVVECQRVTQELESVCSQKTTLTNTCSQLQRDLEEIKEENANLSRQLENAGRSVTKRYKAIVEDLHNKVQTANAERDELKAKITEATSSIELMDQPFQKLSRLLAGRFQEVPVQRPSSRSQKNKPVHDKSDERYEQLTVPKNKKAISIVKRWLNTVLLIILVVITGLTLYFNISLRHNNYTAPPTSIGDTQSVSSHTDLTNNISEPKESSYSLCIERDYDNLNIGRINIRKATPPLKTDKTYTLQILDPTDKANDGRFQVRIIGGNLIDINDNKFTIKGTDLGDKDSVRVKITYITLDGDSVKRIVTLKK